MKGALCRRELSLGLSELRLSRPSLRLRFGDLRGGDLAEQAAALTGLRLDADLQRGELPRDLLGLLEVTYLAHLARAPDRIDLLECAFRCA